MKPLPFNIHDLVILEFPLACRRCGINLPPPRIETIERPEGPPIRQYRVKHQDNHCPLANQELVTPVLTVGDLIPRKAR